ncbi:proteasome activator pa28, REG alpha/beta subunit [Irpex rosettiformis]|uniref:Proteasome activator pa28, REG alpha/beta subunit n=1 Tax=Irpex rosettiformis TaxID=378272 RepID=A0ACB8UL52_9APHY|nr:proteasome activator pa28, REG alpha/beta subunit [Irpex rosettiformis]
MVERMKLDKDLKKQLDEFHDNAALAAEEVLFETFPRKILELQALITSSTSPSSPFHFSHSSTTDTTVYPPPVSLASSEPDSKKRKLDGGQANGNCGLTAGNALEGARYLNLTVENKHLASVHGLIKKECEELADAIDKVKLWINLSMPKIEDGDNFGVQIQEEVLTELHRSQESAYNLRDSARQSHMNRAKLCSKLIKYPHIEDYTLALKEHDEKQLYIARQNLFDIRNVYAILTDILHKNLHKIRSPKGNNATALY